MVSGRPLAKEMHPYPLRQPPEMPPHNHLYRNDGNGKFTDVTEQAGLGGDGFSFSAVAADFDNDGFTDLLVTSYGHVTLYRNKGDGTFEDVTAKAGLDVKGWAIGATWLDYDRDGCVDLFIGRYVKFDPTYRSYYAADNYPGPLDYEADTNLLFHNNCKGTFTDVSEKSGIARLQGPRHGRDGRRFRWRRLSRHLRGQRQDRELPVPQQARRHVRGDRARACRRGIRPERRKSPPPWGRCSSTWNNRGAMDLWVSDSKYNRLLAERRQTAFRTTSPSRPASRN